MSRKRPNIIIIIAIFAFFFSLAQLFLFTQSAHAVTAAIISPNSDQTITDGESISFSGAGTGDGILTYEWDFGGGATNSTVKDPGPVVFSSAISSPFTVTFTVTDNLGSAFDTVLITVLASPIALFTAPNDVFAADLVLFDANSSSDADGTIVKWDWDFGDGNSAIDQTTPTFRHTYNNVVDTTYSVTLTVTDNDGLTDAVTKLINVFVSSTVALFSATPLSGGYPFDVTFTDESISKNSIDSWLWDFGDGSTSTLQSPVYTYNTEGIFDVTLTVTDSGPPPSVDSLTKIDYIDSKNVWRGPGLVVGRCFIATAAYGSYFEPQVKILRDFRDQFLLTNRPGRSFVRLYYKYSPPAADFISRHPALRAITRVALTPLLYLSKFLLYATPFVKLLVLISILSLTSVFFVLRRSKREKV